MPTQTRDTRRICPIFTEQRQREQELAEENRKRDAQRLAANSTKSKHGVIVYTWSEDGKPPAVHEFQSGFSSPFFTLIPEILSVVDLAGAGTTHLRVQLYRRALGVWVDVDAGYVAELRAGDRVFLKASHVQDTLEFDKHLHASVKETMPHL